MSGYLRPRFGLRTGFDDGYTGWGLDAGGYNDAMLRIDAMLHVRVASFTPSDTPPGSPANGLTVIVGSSPTGDFAGNAGKLAIWNSDASAWFFQTPPDGLLATADDTGHLRSYQGGSFIIPPNVEPPVVPPELPTYVASHTPLNTPPTTPSDGDVHLVGTSPSGAWSGQASKLAQWDGAASAWVFFDIPFGAWVSAEDTGHALAWTGSTFDIPSNIEIPSFVIYPTPQGVVDFTPRLIPPSVPVDGQVFWLGAAPSGAWAGQGGKLARYEAGIPGWRFFELVFGDQVLAADTGELRIYNGSTFTVPSNFATPSDIETTPTRVNTLIPQTEPPPLPIEGDVFLVAAGATGDFAGQSNKLALWDTLSALWKFFSIDRGHAVYDDNSGLWYVWDGSDFMLPANIVKKPARVSSFTPLNTPPTTPSDGEVHLVGSTPTGAWAGQGNKLARWFDLESRWRFYSLEYGDAVTAEDDGELRVYDGSTFSTPPNVGGGGPAFDPDTLIPREVVTLTPQNSPPGSPAENDAYIVGSSPTGAFAGQAGKLAKYVNAAWTFFTPPVGHFVVAQDTFDAAAWNGTNWIIPPNLEPSDAFDPDTLIPRELVTITATNSPPGSPAENDAYLVGASPSGAWTGQAGKLAKYVSAAWLFFTPPVGHAVVAQDTRNLFVWNGSAFVAPPNLVYTPPTRKVRVAFSLEGKLTNGMVLARVPFDLAVQFDTTPTGSRADAKTAATASTTTTIVKEEAGGTRTNVGTITWAASGTLATISFTSTTSFAAGDLIEFLGPVTADTTLADIGFLIVGTEA